MLSPLRVLVVDDSLLYRKVVRDALMSIPDVEVVGSAVNGEMAISKIGELRPDLVTLDFEMPGINGLGVLKWLREQRSPTRAVMLSAFTEDGAEATVQALQQGAFDFVLKPSGADPNANRDTLARELAERARTVRFLLERTSHVRPSLRPTLNVTAASAPRVDDPVRVPVTRRTHEPVPAVGIGISTGGPDALRVMLPSLPGDLGVPVFLVQHMPPVFTRSLANSLNRTCRLTVLEAEEGMVAQPNHVYIAPGGKQMKVVVGARGTLIRLTDDPPQHSCRPSVDYLFDSMTEVYGARSLYVIMTGMGYDGAESCRRHYHAGGPVLAQDEATCVVFGMPRKPVTEGFVDVVSPLGEVAPNIERFVRQGGAR